MRALGDLTAVHLALWEQGDGSPTKLCISLPDDQWHAAIIEPPVSDAIRRITGHM